MKNLRNRFCALSFFFFLTSAAVAQQTSTQPASQTEQELGSIAQQLLDAIASGDKAVWERYLAETCLIRDENGGLSTKAELLKQLNPLPEGYVGKIHITDARVQDYGEVAIITHVDREELKLFGQTLITKFTSTDTYLRQNGKWQMIASQISVLPSELTPQPVPVEKMKEVTGQYELTPGIVYDVTIEENKLFGQRTDRPKEELFPENETTYFRKGNPRGLKIFVKNENGQVIKLIDRRDNVDLIWRKTK
jgi:Domain of unknown function (DUF4440)